MADLTKHLQPSVQAVYAAWEKEGNKDKGHRPHLGASLIGNECRRALWYTFRWAKDKHHKGRLLRLFNRGHNEEDIFIKELKSAGFEVYAEDDTTGKQYQFADCGGHFGGSMDGVGRGFLEAPHKWHALEFKTHSDKSFNDLKNNGVEKSKPMHYSQMQIYMHLSGGLDRAFYLAVNKNTDELYSERIRYDEKLAGLLMKKAWDVIQSDKPLERMTEDPTFYKCKFCDYHALCHQQEVAAVNCRTCAHSTAVIDGNATWTCERSGNIIATDKQREGCEDHRFIPDLIPYATASDASEEENWVEYTLADGTTLKNGSKGERCYTSTELHHLDPALVGDKGLEQLRSQFDGKIVG